MKKYLTTTSIVAGIFCSILFYKQMPGLNAILFAAFVLIAFRIFYSEQMNSTSALLAQALIVIAATGCLLNGSLISFFIFIIATCWLAALSKNSLASLPFLPIQMMYASIISPAEALKGKILNHSSSKKNWLLWIPAVVIALAFFFIYKSGNSVFENLVKQINFDFISLLWVLFTILTIWFCLTIFHYKSIAVISVLESTAVNQHEINNEKINTALQNEGKTSINLRLCLNTLILLNILLLVVNAGDVYVFFLGGRLPENTTYANLLHEGSGLLSLSVILAILVLLILFKPSLHFAKNNVTLIVMAHLWLIQNLVMVVTLGAKNVLYINNYDLTHFRIGIFVWLMIVTSGIVLTLYSFYKKYSIWWLLKNNSVAVLGIYAMFNWDVFIAKFNIQMSAQKKETPDYNYLIGLNDDALPIIYENYKLQSIVDSTEINYSVIEQKNKQMISYLYDRIKLDHDRRSKKTWQSFTISNLKWMDVESKIISQDAGL